MNKSVKLSLMMAIALLLTSCGPKLALVREHFTVTPEVLESVGGQVDASIDGVIPEKMFPAKAVVTITPVLKYEGGEVEGSPLSLQGEKVKGNSQVIPTKAGGSFKMKSSFDYIPAMQRSELYARIAVVKGKKTVVHPEIKLADGVIATEALANAKTATPANSQDKFQRIIQEETQANIMFLIQQSNIRSSELKSEEVKALANAIAAAAKAENKEVSGVKISSYASPDGAVALNEKLAAQREKNTTGYINRELKKAKATASVDADFTAEDWAGFQELLMNSNIQDKDLILRVLSMYSDPERRETEIKNLASAYKALADEILPQLRRSKMTLTVDVIGRSDEEIISTLFNDPARLSIDELLYAATLFNPTERKEAVYRKAVELYPDDYRAYNNLGNLAYAAGKIDEAKAWYEKAYAKEQAAEVCVNMALCAMAENADKAVIEKYLSQAAGAEGYEQAMGLYNIRKGQYAEAAKAYGETASNNAALAQILAKNYTKAKTLLDQVDPKDAETYYLMALVGAKTNNKEDVVAGLKQAVTIDPSLKEKVLKDVEFAKYATDQAILSIVK
ncbi:MAG: tetratricopeptide repeat protein [Bacteroidales bacterium]|nr:tetratricopeptide repeat protein [Bacteroidales bacterium]